MSFVLAKKPSQVNTPKKNSQGFYRVTRNSYIIHPNTPVQTLQRKPNCPCGGGCPGCQQLKSPIQTKLKIGEPNDPFEQEADRVADQVMRMPVPRLFSSLGDSSLANRTITRSGTIQRVCVPCSEEYKTAKDENRPVEPTNLCPKCRSREKGLIQTKQITPLIHRQESLVEEEDEELIQAKTTENATPEVTPAISSGIQSMQGGGRPLSGSERSFFEPRFGTVFPNVRIHNGTRANSVARLVNARAFTFGHNVVFGAGEYSSDTLAGRNLLAHEMAHELMHVVQQNNQKQDVVTGRMIQRDTDRPEPQRQASPRFGSNCGEFHRCNVIEPLKAAKQIVDAVLRELPPLASGSVTSGRIIDLLNVHFHTASQSDIQTILTNFQQIRRELDALIRYNCRSDDPNACKAEKGFVGAETTCTVGADILLCSAYFVGLDCEDQARVLIHEVTHHLPGMCQDHAYVHEQKYMTLSPADAMSNADTYAQFSKMVHLGSITCPDCSFETQVRPGRY